MQCSLLLNNPTFVLIGFKAANFQNFLTWFWFCLTPLVLVRLELCLFWPPWQDPFQRCPQLISLFLQNVGVPCHDTVSQELKVDQHLLGMGLFVSLYSSESIRWLEIPHKARESSQNYISTDKRNNAFLVRGRRLWCLSQERQSRGGGGDPATLLHMKLKVNVKWTTVKCESACERGSELGSRKSDHRTSFPWHTASFIKIG